MGDVIYIDVLFFINFIINLLLLVLSAVLCGEKLSSRVFLGAFISALYGVIMLFPSFKFYYSAFFKILFCMLTILVSFSIKSYKKQAKSNQPICFLNGLSNPSVQSKTHHRVVVCFCFAKERPKVV